MKNAQSCEVGNEKSQANDVNEAMAQSMGHYRCIDPIRQFATLN